MTTFSFSDWFNSLSSSQERHDKFENSVIDLLSNKLDVSHYRITHTLIPSNLGFIEKDENDKYFVEIGLQKNDNDISTGFMVYPFYGSENSPNDLKLNLKINSKILPINAGTTIINCCTMYTELKVRITFDNEPFAVRMTYVANILQSNLRADLMSQKFIQDGILYSAGVAIPT